MSYYMWLGRDAEMIFHRLPVFVKRKPQVEDDGFITVVGTTVSWSV